MSVVRHLSWATDFSKFYAKLRRISILTSSSLVVYNVRAVTTFAGHVLTKNSIVTTSHTILRSLSPRISQLNRLSAPKNDAWSCNNNVGIFSHFNLLM